MGWSPVVSLAGDDADKPAAAALPVGSLWLSTDVDGGTLYRTDGSTWTAVAAAIEHGHSDAYSGEILVQDGTTPPEPLTLEDGTDYLYKD